MKTFAKCALAATIAAAVLAFSAFAAYFAVTNDVKLDTNKLINYGQSITFYDADGNKIDRSSLIGNRSSVGIKDLPAHVKNAFIASEDRKFYYRPGEEGLSPWQTQGEVGADEECYSENGYAAILPEGAAIFQTVSLGAEMYDGYFYAKGEGTVRVQVGQQYVIPHVSVNPSYGQHPCVAVLISVHKYRRAADRTGSAGVHRMVAFAVGRHNKRVTQRAGLLHAVNPLAHIRILGQHLPVAFSRVTRVGSWRKSVVKHVPRRAESRQKERSKHRGDCNYQCFLHFIFPVP